MADREGERGSRRVLKALATLLVLALVAGGAWAWRTGEADDLWHRLRGDADPTDPAAVAPPPALDLPGVVPPPAVADPADGTARLDKAAVQAALAPLGKPALGKHVLATVAPLEGTGPGYVQTEGSPLAVPASTTKLVTSAAALFTLGPDKVFETTTVLDSSGTTPRLTLVGGGDPYLARAPVKAEPGGPSPTFQVEHADITTLAKRTARALKAQGVRRVALAFDDSLFSGPAVNPAWEADYVPDDVVSPISALWVDEGREPDSSDRSPDPAAAAAAAFRKALARFRIKVAGPPVRAKAVPGAQAVAKVRSAPLAQIVQRLVEVSDNEAAEVLLRQVGVADQGIGSSTAGRAAVTRVLTANHVPLRGTTLYDGSGLSRHDRMSPSVLVGVLRLAASPDHPELRSLLASLPVAGYTGSLAERMDTDPAAGRGRVRAKTGTLSGVTSLAGIAEDLDGHLMAFVLMADHVKKPKEGIARIAMDKAAAGLGACHCTR